MKKLIVECIGTFFLVLTVALTGSPIAIGFILVALVYMGGYISGAHYNPAVTIGLWISKKLDRRTAFRYILAQLVGGIAASAVYGFIKKDFFIPGPDVKVGMASAFFIEMLFTFLLVSVVHHVAASDKTKGNQYYGLAIGFTVMAAAIAGGPISGGAFNPAVGVSPLLYDVTNISTHISSIMLYTVAPVTGGILGALVFKYLK